MYLLSICITNYTCLSVYICLSDRLSIILSVCLSISLFVCLSDSVVLTVCPSTLPINHCVYTVFIDVSIYMSIYCVSIGGICHYKLLSVCLTLFYLSVCLSVFLLSDCIHLSVYLSVCICLSICKSLWMPVCYSVCLLFCMSVSVCLYLHHIYDCECAYLSSMTSNQKVYERLASMPVNRIYQAFLHVLYQRTNKLTIQSRCTFFISYQKGVDIPIRGAWPELSDYVSIIIV